MPKTNIVDGKRPCVECQRVLTIDNFRKQKTRGWSSYCFDCSFVVNKRNRVKCNFGITVEKYDEIMKDGCMICGSYFRLSLDHDHACCEGTRSCGECLRGALCMRHNLALGHVNDSIEELEALITYLEGNGK